MKAFRNICVAALVALAIVPLGIETSAISPRDVSAAQAEHKAPDSAMSVETSPVNLDVLVTDQDGRILSGWRQENFRILDDGTAQAITHFEATTAPMSIAMRMEHSGSAYNY